MLAFHTEVCEWFWVNFCEEHKLCVWMPSFVCGYPAVQASYARYSACYLDHSQAHLWEKDQLPHFCRGFLKERVVLSRLCVCSSSFQLSGRVVKKKKKYNSTSGELFTLGGSPRGLGVMEMFCPLIWVMVTCKNLCTIWMLCLGCKNNTGGSAVHRLRDGALGLCYSVSEFPTMWLRSLCCLQISVFSCVKCV